MRFDIVITGVMTGGDPDTLQTSFTVAEGFGDAVADFTGDGYIICSLTINEQQLQRQFYNQ